MLAVPGTRNRSHRLRQRRPRRPRHRRRRQAARAAQPRRAAARRRERRGGRGRDRAARRGWRRATSTATATSTSWWRATARRRSSCATTAATRTPGWSSIARGLNDNKTGVGTRVEVRAGGRFQRARRALGRRLPLAGAAVAALRPRAREVGGHRPPALADGRAAGRAGRRRPRHACAWKSWTARARPVRSSTPGTGARMRFQADMIGAGVIGQWAGPGARNVSDPDEYFLVEGAAPDDDGRLRFALVEQMEEVTYLDAARLLAVDHPRGVRVFPNERFTGAPPFPAFGVVQLRDAWAPVAARTSAERTSRRRVRERDGRYVRVPKTDLVGFAQPHHVELDLGPRAEAGVARLVLRGYTEYFYPRTLYAAAQRGLAPRASGAGGVPRRRVGEGRRPRHPRRPAALHGGRPRGRAAPRGAPRPHRLQHGGVLGPGPRGRRALGGRACGPRRSRRRRPTSATTASRAACAATPRSSTSTTRPPPAPTPAPPGCTRDTAT